MIFSNSFGLRYVFVYIASGGSVLLVMKKSELRQNNTTLQRK